MKLEKLIKGYKQIIVKGKCNTKKRKELLEEAISYFQENKNPERKEYFGLKEYASFGEQRSDHTSCHGPRYGTIVFKIDYRRDNVFSDDINWKPLVDENGIYLLTSVLVNKDMDVFNTISQYLDCKEGMEKELKIIENINEFNINE